MNHKLWHILCDIWYVKYPILNYRCSFIKFLGGPSLGSKLIFSSVGASEFYYSNNKMQNYYWRISKSLHIFCAIWFHSFSNCMLMEVANAYNWCGISWCYLSIYTNLLPFEIQTRQSSNDTGTMGDASGWSHFLSWSASSDKKVGKHEKVICL